MKAPGTVPERTPQASLEIKPASERMIDGFSLGLIGADAYFLAIEKLVDSALARLAREEAARQ